MFFTLLLYDKVPFTYNFSATEDTLYIIWYLLNVTTFAISWEWHEGKKLGTTWHGFIKSIIHIFTEKSHLKLPHHLFDKENRELGGLSNNFAQVSTTMSNLYWKGWLQHLHSSYHNIGQSVLKTLSFIRKNVNEIHMRLKFFSGSNLNFRIRSFTWGLANDDNILRKYSVQLYQ